MKTLFALLMVAAPAFAQDLVADGQVRTVSHEVAVEIHDRIAATTVTQVFENHDRRVREGFYTFAVPPGASIVEFQMWIDGRVMKGQMLERQKAESIYRTIVTRKKDPGILDQVRDRVWRVRVFPIPPQGGQMKFMTRYVEVLPCAAGQVAYTLPFSIPEEKLQKMDQFSLQIDVHAAAPVTTIDAPGLSIVKRSAARFVATGDRTNIAFDKDLVLRYVARPAGQDFALMAHRVAGNDGTFLLSVTPDLAAAASERLSNEVIYLLDASTSMDDKLFRRLAASIAEGLQELGPRDRFNIVAFNAEVTRFQKTSVERTSANVAAAIRFLEQLKPEGRTDLRKALLDVAAQKATQPRAVFLVSDGSASAGCLDGREIVRDALQAFDGDTVVYGVQVGDSSERTLETLARRTGGVCLPADDHGLEKTLRAAQKRVSRPVLTNVRFDFGEADVRDLHAPRLIFADEPVLVAGRYHAPGTHDVTMTGRVGGREIRITRALEFPERHEGWASAAFVWAGRQIESLLDSAFMTTDNEAIKSTVVALSIEHRIMTPYTAFLVLENDEMYAQYGLKQTIVEERPLFAPPKPGKGPKPGAGRLGLPEPPVKVLDVLAPTADATLLDSLRWLATNVKQYTPYKEGELALSATGVSALALRALELSDAYGLSEEDRKSFESAVHQMLDLLRKAQDRHGRIGETLQDHVFASEALVRLLRWHPEMEDTREMLQKAVTWLSDYPNLQEKRTLAALAAPVLAQARALRIEVDAATLKQLERSIEGAPDILYLRALMALSPFRAKEERVAAVARRVAEKGPVDPIAACLGTEALYAWRGESSAEWRAWQRKIGEFKKLADGASWVPRGQKEEARSASTALRTLALEESNVEVQRH